MKPDFANDPDKKEKANDEVGQPQNENEGVVAYNLDGTPMDTSDRTYISADLPEDENAENSDE